MQGVLVLSYLARLLVTRALGFFVHWYRDGLHAWWSAYRSMSSSLEEMVASRAMVHLLFRPLYGDYSIVGRIIGPIFRLGRLVLGGVGHLIILLFFTAAMLVWSVIPLLLIAHATGLIR